MKRSKISRPVLSPDALHPFLGKELLGAWKEFRRRWRKCRTKPSESAVHALRVEARRLLAELELLAGLGLETAVVPLRLPIRRLLTSLSKLRDAQVHRELLKAWKAEFADRTWLERELRRLTRRLRRKADAKLGDFSGPERVEAVRALAKVIREHGRDPAVQRQEARSLILIVERSFARVRSLQKRVVATDPASLHAVRVAFKAFRYQVAFLAPLLGITESAYLERLRRFQEHLGEFNDGDLWARRLAQIHAEHPKRASLARLRRAVEAKAKRSLQRCVAELEQMVTFWPPPGSRD